MMETAQENTALAADNVSEVRYLPISNCIPSLDLFSSPLYSVSHHSKVAYGTRVDVKVIQCICPRAQFLSRGRTMDTVTETLFQI